jgi:membrane protein implicated in regulation of membrane protease activity
MLIFAAIGAFGLLFLLIMLFFGGDHDLHMGDMDGGHDVSHAADGEGGPSIFSSRIIASFVAAFGFGGTIGRYLEFGYPVSSSFGIVSGVVLASIVFKFAEILYSQQASSEVRMTSLVGMTAEVAIAIPAGHLGQVSLSAAGERSMHIARSLDGKAIPQGTSVVIRELRGDYVVVERQ